MLDKLITVDKNAESRPPSYYIDINTGRFGNEATTELFFIIMSSADNFSIDKVKELVENRSADVFAKDQEMYNNSLLLWGIANSNIAKSIELLDYLTTDPNFDKETVFKEIINYQCRINKNTALHLAITKGWEHKHQSGLDELMMQEIIKKLLSCGADPNIQNAEGNTPLHVAIMKQEFEAADLLIQYGAKPDLHNNEGIVCYDPVGSKKDILTTPYNDAKKYCEQHARIFSLSYFTPINQTPQEFVTYTKKAL